MTEERKGVSDKARVALNVLAIRAIETAQRVNQGPSQVDQGRLSRALDEIETRIREARQELGGGA